MAKQEMDLKINLTKNEEELKSAEAKLEVCYNLYYWWTTYFKNILIFPGNWSLFC